MNKPDREKDFDEKFREHLFVKMNGRKELDAHDRFHGWWNIDMVKSYISSLLSKVIDEIELEQGEFQTSPVDERFDAGYDKAIVDFDKVKKLKRQKYGIS